MHAARRPHALISLTAVGLIGLASLLGGCSTTSALALEEGDCMVSPTDDSDEISNVTTTVCTDEHDAEVIGVTTIDGDTLPDSDALDAQAQTDCLSAFSSYVGSDYETSSLDLTWMVPTQDSWDKAHDREIVCVAVSGDGSSLTQSVKGSQL